MSKFGIIFDRTKRDKDSMSIYNYQSRILGIFSEEIVKIWADEKEGLSDYKYIGRPTIYLDNNKRYTYDFVFQSKQDNKIYVVEMKCWLPFENFKYFVLKEDFLQKAKEQESSFGTFLKMAHKKPQKHVNNPNHQPKSIDGFILIWGTIAPDTIEKLKSETGLHEIFGLEDIIQAMIDKKHEPYFELIRKYQKWSNSLFEELAK